MSSDPLENAQSLRLRIQARLAAIEAERTELIQQLSSVSRFLDTAEQYAQLDPHGSIPPKLTNQRSSGGARRPARNPRREDVLDLVVEIIVAKGRPMRLREMYDAVTAKGITLIGTNPVAVLGTMMWRGGRERRLINLKGFGYWPRHLPFAPAAYAPEAPSTERGA